MRTNSQYKKIQWLMLSSLMAGALTACPGPVQEASFEITANALGSSFVDGSQIQPAEAIVKNASNIAGMPPQVSFNISSDLEYSSIDNNLYGCEATSDILVVCTAKDGAKLEALAQTSLKPVFELAFQNVPVSPALQTKTRQTTSQFGFPISISSAALPAPVNLVRFTATPASSGFDLIIDKTVSKPFVIDASGNGSGEFTITASLASPTPLPSYVKIQDPVLPAGYAYDWAAILARNTATTPVYPWKCVKTGPVAGPWGVSCTLKPAFLSTYPYPALTLPVKVSGLTTTSTQQNCPWLYPLLGDTVNNNNHLGPAPYAKPCTKYTPTKTDLGIAKTQIAPLTTPANSFYWGLPGQYQIVVTNNSGPALSTVTIQDVLTNLPGGSVIAFTASSPITTSPGWTCTGTFPTLTCSYSGAPVAAGQSFPPLVLNVTLKPENPALANGETNCATLVTVTQTPTGTSVVPISDANNQNNKSCIDSQNMALELFDVAIVKKHLNTSVAPGGVVNYALIVSNTGGDAPGPIVVTDTLPAAAFSSTPAPTVTVTPASAATCTVAGLVITCSSSGSLPGGSSYTVNINATTNANATGSITNTATVSSYLNSSDSNLQNNTSSDVLVLTPPINLHRAESVVQTSNGDFIVVGSSDSATRGKQFAVRRYASDGTTVIWTDVRDFSAFDDTAFDVAIDGTGDIVVVGRTDLDPSRDSRAVIVKYDATSLTAPISDIGFPNPIFLGSNTDSNLDQFVAVAVDKSNRIITGGVDGMGTLNQDLRWVIHRFSSTGIADNTFGANGRVMTDVSNKLNYTSGNWYNNNQALRDVLVEDRSDIYRIYAAGNAPTGSQQQISVIARYTNAGVLDSTWNTSGIVETHITDGLIVTTAATQDSNITELAMQEVPNPSNPAITIQRLVATGTNCVDAFCYAGASTQIKNCVVTRYNLVDGSSDTTFGTGGIASFGKPSGNAIGGKQCNAIAVKPSTGEIAVSGSNLNGSSSIDYDYMALKLSANGALVSSYGGDNPNGYATSVIPVITPRFDASWGVTWTAAGNIMTVGYTDKDATDKDEWVVKGY